MATTVEQAHPTSKSPSPAPMPRPIYEEEEHRKASWSSEEVTPFDMSHRTLSSDTVPLKNTAHIEGPVLGNPDCAAEFQQGLTSTENYPFEAPAPEAGFSGERSIEAGHLHILETSNCGLDDIDVDKRSIWSFNHRDDIIRGPYDYISSSPGKEFRTQLVNALNLWHRVPIESLGAISTIIRMLHNASLLVDDIEDNSSLRRGRPVAHDVYGIAQTINSANFVYFLALEELQKLRRPQEAVAIFTQEMLALHRGQGMDLFWRDTLSCPTEGDYLEMVSNKTGGLFRLAARLMQSESDMDVDCIPLIDVLGLVFQIADDYRNMADQNYAENKGYYEDLTEGKFSFPIIHSMRVCSGNSFLLNVLSQRPTALEVKREAVRHMESTGSLKHTRKIIETLADKAKSLVIELDRKCDVTSSVALPLVEKIARI